MGKPNRTNPWCCGYPTRKNGKTSAGKQRYRCTCCNKTITDTYKEHGGYRWEKQKKIDNLNSSVFIIDYRHTERNDMTTATAFTQTYAGQSFLALTEVQQAFVKNVIISVIRQYGYVCTHDMANAMRMELLRNVPDFDYRKVTDHVQAGVWALEVEGRITRQKEGHHTTLRIAA